MKFVDFLSKRVPTNFFIKKEQKILINFQYPGDMIDGEDKIEYKTIPLTDAPEDFFKNENLEEIKKMASELLPNHTGFLIVKNEDSYEFRFFVKGTEETEHSRLRVLFEALNRDFKIKRSNLEFIHGGEDAETLMKQLRITIETNLKNAQLKRERKASKRMLKAS
jgi:hypothetical protein